MMADPVRLSVPSLGNNERLTTSSFDTSKSRTPSRRMTMGTAIRSPPVTPISPGSQAIQFPALNPLSHPRTIRQDPLTPPTSPLSSESTEFSSPQVVSKSLSSISPQHQQEKPSIDSFILGSTSGQITSPEEIPFLECPHELEHLRDATGKCVEFGAGAWSTVYKCVTRSKSAHVGECSISTHASLKSPSPLVVAVKTPHRKDGQAILRSEARILSYLAGIPRVEERMVSFYGWDFKTSSIVMSAVPLNLEDHVIHCRTEMSSMYKRSFRGVPVVGSEMVWLSLASQLVDSLQWLHDIAGVVHGDIKPQNILLRSTESEFDCESSYQLSSTPFSTFPYTPLFADFSSSHLVNSLSRSPGALSAVTPQYTAPELQASNVLRNPETLPTTAADVFSLATTLLVCATGDLNVYPSPMAMQRMAMAKQGWQVIQFAQNGADGLRIPQGGIVQKMLERSVAKINDKQGRCNAREWNAILKKGLRNMNGDKDKMGRSERAGTRQDLSFS